MTDKNEIDAMAKLLGKLNNVGAQAETRAEARAAGKPIVHEDPTSMAAQTDAMADILRKLQTVSTEAVTESVEKSKTDRSHVLEMAYQTDKIESGVSIAKYSIISEQSEIIHGQKKNFYNIINNETGNTVVKNLGLFETAMGIVKHFLYSKDWEQRVQRLLDFDNEYIGALAEAYTLKGRMRLNENSGMVDNAIQLSVVQAKFDKAKERIGAAKTKILKAL